MSTQSRARLLTAFQHTNHVQHDLAIGYRHAIWTVRIIHWELRVLPAHTLAPNAALDIRLREPYLFILWRRDPYAPGPTP
jgi:hypothetical protein